MHAVPFLQINPVRTLVKGQINHAGIDGIWVADEISWRQLESKLLQASLSLDASSCTEAGPEVAVFIDEAAAWRLWPRFLCALDVAVATAGFSAACS